MKLIVGLGNPGDKYLNSRHNLGFMVVDALAKAENLSWKTEKKFNAQLILKNQSENPFILLRNINKPFSSGSHTTKVSKPEFLKCFKSDGNSILIFL